MSGSNIASLDPVDSAIQILLERGKKRKGIVTWEEILSYRPARRSAATPLQETSFKLVAEQS